MLWTNASVRIQRQIQRRPPKRQAPATKSKETSKSKPLLQRLKPQCRGAAEVVAKATTYKDSQSRAFALLASSSVRFAESEALAAIVADAKKAWVRKGVEGPQIGRGRKIDEGGRSGNDGGAHLIDIELRAESGGVAI